MFFHLLFGTIGTVLAGTFGLVWATTGIERAIKTTGWLALGMAVGVLGVLALFALGGGFA